MRNLIVYKGDNLELNHVDLDDNTSIGITYQSFDVAKPSEIKVNCSNEFSIPLTRNNSKIFDAVWLPTSNVNYIDYDCDYWVDNYKIISGKAYVTKVEGERIHMFIYDKSSAIAKLKNIKFIDFETDYLQWCNNNENFSNYFPTINNPSLISAIKDKIISEFEVGAYNEYSRDWGTFKSNLQKSLNIANSLRYEYLVQLWNTSIENALIGFSGLKWDNSKGRYILANKSQTFYNRNEYEVNIVSFLSGYIDIGRANMYFKRGDSFEYYYFNNITCHSDALKSNPSIPSEDDYIVITYIKKVFDYYDSLYTKNNQIFDRRNKPSGTNYESFVFVYNYFKALFNQIVNFSKFSNGKSYSDITNIITGLSSTNYEDRKSDVIDAFSFAWQPNKDSKIKSLPLDIPSHQDDYSFDLTKSVESFTTGKVIIYSPVFSWGKYESIGDGYITMYNKIKEDYETLTDYINNGDFNIVERNKINLDLEYNPSVTISLPIRAILMSNSEEDSNVKDNNGAIVSTNIVLSDNSTEFKQYAGWLFAPSRYVFEFLRDTYDIVFDSNEDWLYTDQEMLNYNTQLNDIVITTTQAQWFYSVYDNVDNDTPRAKTMYDWLMMFCRVHNFTVVCRDNTIKFKSYTVANKKQVDIFNLKKPNSQNWQNCGDFTSQQYTINYSSADTEEAKVIDTISINNKSLSEEPSELFSTNSTRITATQIVGSVSEEYHLVPRNTGSEYFYYARINGYGKIHTPREINFYINRLNEESLPTFTVMYGYLTYPDIVDTAQPTIDTTFIKRIIGDKNIPTIYTQEVYLKLSDIYTLIERENYNLTLYYFPELLGYYYINKIENINGYNQISACKLTLYKYK